MSQNKELILILQCSLLLSCLSSPQSLGKFSIIMLQMQNKSVFITLSASVPGASGQKNSSATISPWNLFETDVLL